MFIPVSPDITKGKQKVIVRRNMLQNPLSTSIIINILKGNSSSCNMSLAYKIVIKRSL